MNAIPARLAPRPRPGIVAGSGPEAGIDPWVKLLRHNAAAMGAAFRGDIDAPRVSILSDPLLVLSMDLACNELLVWETLMEAAATMAMRADHWVIACNTLNWFAPRIEALCLPGEFVSFQSVLADWVAASGVARLGLVGAGPVTEMEPRSAYRSLPDLVEIQTPADPAAPHARNDDVKRLGSGASSLRPRLRPSMPRRWSGPSGRCSTRAHHMSTPARSASPPLGCPPCARRASSTSSRWS